MTSPVTLITRDWLDWPQTRTLVHAFADTGQELRFVGGAVRDGLLGRAVREVDAATPATPERVTALLEQAGIKAVPTGIDHGTITAVVDGKPFEITTLRKDTACDGRHAEIAYTDSWEEDAQRRDFTMNALYCSPEGDLFDYTGGAEDGRAGRVRFIGEATQRIEEDGLRILRFFRFFAHYGEGEPDVAALAACGEKAAMLDSLSGERIQTEMLKLLTSPNIAATLGQMQQTDVLPHVLPLPAVPPSLTHLPNMCAALDCGQDGEVALVLLLRSLPESERSEALEELAARWKLSGMTQKRLKILLAEKLLAAGTDEATLKRHIRRLGAEWFGDLVLISACTPSLTLPLQGERSGGEAATGGGGVKELSSYRAMRTLAREWQPPTFPITGDDLKTLGIAPGPDMGRLLKELESYWEAEGYAPDRKALLGRAAP